MELGENTVYLAVYKFCHQPLWRSVYSALPFESRKQTNEVFIFEVVAKGTVPKSRSVLIVVVEAEIRLFSATTVQTSLGQRSSPVVHSAAEWLMKGRKGHSRCAVFSGWPKSLRLTISVHGWRCQRSRRNATKCVGSQSAVNTPGLDAVRDLASWIFAQQKSPSPQKVASDAAHSNSRTRAYF